MDQDQQRVRRYRDFGRRVFGSIFSAAKYCPEMKNSTPCFFISAIAFRFGLLVPNFAL